MPLVSGFWTGACSLRRDGPATQQKIAPGYGQAYRLRFTAAYRWTSAAYLALITVDAVLGVANLVIRRSFVDQRRHHRAERGRHRPQPRRGGAGHRRRRH